MKSFFSAVCSIALLLLSASCNSSDTEKKATSPLLGHWRLDSISAPEEQQNIGLLLLAMASEDSSGNSIFYFDFREDSVYYDFTDGDTTKAAYQFQSDKNLLVLTRESEVDTLHYELTKDSTMILTGNDSVSLYLRKRL